MGPVFSPLDEELQLFPGSSSPYLHEAMVRLGTWMPFERVPAELHFFTHATVSIETVRRLTEGAGAALVAAESREAERLERVLPLPSEGPTVQQLSADGAMVPLLKGEWAEVKTLALGTVGQRLTREGEQVVCTTNPSYFSRLIDAEQFGRLATIATHAAGTTRAGTVVAVVDGAEWLQGFIDLQCPQAVRILDFPHAAEYVSKVAHAVWGEGSPTATAWLDQHLHELKHGDPDAVLTALVDLPVATVAAAETRNQVIAYLTKRRAQIAYAHFQEHGYPIGDGLVESANKLVVEARLKGGGMHWARVNVNPMVALRACVCSDQWQRGWEQVTADLRRQVQAQRSLRRAMRRAAKAIAIATVVEPDESALKTPVALVTAPNKAKRMREKTIVNGRPTANHPWKRPLWPDRAPSRT